MISRNVQIVLFAAMLVATAGFVIPVNAQDCVKAGCPVGQPAVHKISQTPDGIAIEGYDTVAYHTEGRPVKGRPDFTYAWGGARWNFASAANRDRFAANPEQYAPQYGGYCNMAMAKNKIKAGDPNAWAIIDGKLRLFASKKGRNNFLKNTAGNIGLAAQNSRRLHPSQ